MSERAAPQYCPYCGEDTLRPDGELTEHARWRCESCLRAFELRYKGLELRYKGLTPPPG